MIHLDHGLQAHHWKQHPSMVRTPPPPPVTTTVVGPVKTNASGSRQSSTSPPSPDPTAITSPGNNDAALSSSSPAPTAPDHRPIDSSSLSVKTPDLSVVVPSDTTATAGPPSPAKIEAPSSPLKSPTPPDRATKTPSPSPQTHSPELAVKRKVALVLELNAELIKICSELQTRNMNNSPDFQQCSVRLQSNLTWLAAAADKPLGPQQTAVQRTMPTLQPPVLPSNPAIAFSEPTTLAIKRIAEIYHQLPTLFSKDVKRRERSFSNGIRKRPAPTDDLTARKRLDTGETKTTPTTTHAMSPPQNPSPPRHPSHPAAAAPSPRMRSSSSASPALVPGGLPLRSPAMTNMAAPASGAFDPSQVNGVDHLQLAQAQAQAQVQAQEREKMRQIMLAQQLQRHQHQQQQQQQQQQLYPQLMQQRFEAQRRQGQDEQPRPQSSSGTSAHGISNGMPPPNTFPVNGSASQSAQLMQYAANLQQAGQNGNLNMAANPAAAAARNQASAMQMMVQMHQQQQQAQQAQQKLLQQQHQHQHQQHQQQQQQHQHQQNEPSGDTPFNFNNILPAGSPAFNGNAPFVLNPGAMTSTNPYPNVGAAVNPQALGAINPQSLAAMNAPALGGINPQSLTGGINPQSLGGVNMQSLVNPQAALNAMHPPSLGGAVNPQSLTARPPTAMQQRPMQGMPNMNGVMQGGVPNAAAMLGGGGGAGNAMLPQQQRQLYLLQQQMQQQSHQQQMQAHGQPQMRPVTGVNPMSAMTAQQAAFLRQQQQMEALARAGEAGQTNHMSPSNAPSPGMHSDGGHVSRPPSLAGRLNTQSPADSAPSPRMGPKARPPSHPQMHPPSGPVPSSPAQQDQFNLSMITAQQQQATFGGPLASFHHSPAAQPMSISSPSPQLSASGLPPTTPSNAGSWQHQSRFPTMSPPAIAPSQGMSPTQSISPSQVYNPGGGGLSQGQWSPAHFLAQSPVGGGSQPATPMPETVDPSVFGSWS